MVIVTQTLKPSLDQAEAVPFVQRQFPPVNPALQPRAEKTRGGAAHSEVIAAPTKVAGVDLGGA